MVQIDPQLGSATIEEVLSNTAGSVADQRPSVSLFFPAYNDSRAIEDLTIAARSVLSQVAREYEIVIVNDGSADDTGEIADELARRYDEVQVIHHPVNRGYGGAVQTGFRSITPMEWICFTDGDNQYDVHALLECCRHVDRYDVIAGFRLRKTYGLARRVLSRGLNLFVRLLFRVRLRDVNCGFKMVRREVMQDINVTATGPLGGAEVAIRAAIKGYAIGEVGISSYERSYGKSNIVRFRSILGTFGDLVRLRREIFRNAPRPQVTDLPNSH